jgi:hypothetical protein
MLPSTVASDPTVAHEMPQAFAPCGQRGKIRSADPAFRRLIQTGMHVESDVSVPPQKQ